MKYIQSRHMTTYADFLPRGMKVAALDPNNPALHAFAGNPPVPPARPGAGVADAIRNRAEAIGRTTGEGIRAGAGAAGRVGGSIAGAPFTALDAAFGGPERRSAEGHLNNAIGAGAEGGDIRAKLHRAMPSAGIGRGAMLGALLGGAAGGFFPGKDEDGEQRGVLSGIIRGALPGALTGGLAGYGWRKFVNEPTRNEYQSWINGTHPASGTMPIHPDHLHTEPGIAPATGMMEGIMREANKRQLPPSLTRPPAEQTTGQQQ